MNKFSQNSINNREGVNRKLIAISDMALNLSIIDFGIPQLGGLRTTDQQRILYFAGKSKCDGVTSPSKHQSGNALDVYAYVDGKASWEEHHLTLVAAAMLQAASHMGYKLSWGGLWTSFQDMPHFQLEVE